MMSQRTIHSCVTNMNMETIQCEAYAGKLGPKMDKGKGAPAGHKAPPNRIIRECSTPTTYKTTSMASGRMKQVRVETSKPEKPKTAPKMRANSIIAQGPTWSKILKPQASKENICTFTNFNPLRTIHFLTNELGSQLREELPHNKNIHHMIMEMQQALCRIPEEVTAALQDSRVSGKHRMEMKPTKLGERDPFQNVYTSVKPITSCIATQTLPTLYLEPDKVHKHLESSTVKIEHACNQMESMCTKVKAEKMELESLLMREKETTKLYQKQLEEYKLKYTTGNALIESLQKKIDEYEREIKKLRLQMESYQGPTSQELKSLIKQLQDEKNTVLIESQELKQKIALAQMDCDKYRAILQARDAQVKEIRNEMTQLQEVVNEQLMELQNNAYTSEASSYSNTTCSPSSTWKNEKTELGVCVDGGGGGNNTLSSINSADSVAHHNSLYNSPKQISHLIELNSGDTTATSDLTHEFHNVKPSEKPTKKRNEKLKVAPPVGAQTLSVNFREKFAKIKMDALGCDPRKAEK
ncbi:PREDICTED: uncharacterized protein LOC108556630 isoform X2 [Nicrophorus vespilloides]|uniref:Uncharacterized protein LOC108556630 isoform X1 n=1 Tax=Nicrophorus vespilloides TaxID=110193 RepID=A0ABM1M152_NICVS|nr:PREDICTED: uncharacterized protein LOC108556630 isoform X1 [Nicrophorus vespilloides]XP_017768303.1 PREDICTED: uncharacterized protein LOC108556630 isoform X2 [Nicrophorus vespilloides]